MDEPENIPQIKPDVGVPEPGTPSILVPKTQGEVPPRPQVPRPRLNYKVVTGIGIALVVAVFLIVLPLFNFYKKAMAFVAEGKKLASVAKAQNIGEVKSEISKTKKSLAEVASSYKLISWMRIIPFAGGYIADAGHGIKAGTYGLDALDTIITTAEPYMDTLGFGRNTKGGDGAKTTQERIDFFVKAIPSLIPKIGDISDKVNKAKAEIDQVNPDRYPVKAFGRQVREPLRNGLTLFDQSAQLVSQAKPLLESAPYLLGLDKPRTYLVLFQNDKELRPTGGFMTAYSIMKVDKGKFEPVASNDIYNLDAQYTPRLPAPDPIVKYIRGPYVLSQNIRLRDMNWSPDFAESMKLFSKEAARVGIPEIDGIIGVDTQVLVYLLDSLGQIGVPGFGNFSTKIEPKCSCPQVIYELESFADVEGPIIWDPLTGKIIYRPPNSDNRKKIIGPLMNSILANAMGQPKDKLPSLFEAGFKSLLEKHVLFYLFDADAQKGVESFGIAGRIKDYQGDYLHVNDANLGGRKSNLYVTQEVEQEIKVSRDGSVEKTITITYKNPEKQDGWLNSVLPNWVRVYVPKGSSLIASEGFESKAEPYEELGKTVFAGFFQLRPQGVSKVTLKYKLPFKVSKEYNFLIQKQPGTLSPQYTLTLGKHQEEFSLKEDRELKIRI